MWLWISLAIVGVAIVLVTIFALSAWRRWQRVRRAGGRFNRRVGSLNDAAALLADRLEFEERITYDR